MGKFAHCSIGSNESEKENEIYDKIGNQDEQNSVIMESNGKMKRALDQRRIKRLWSLIC